MKNFEYTVETNKSFEEAVSAVEQNTAARGFRVLHTHDVAATLAEKGFQREPLKIVEICNAKYAHEVLQINVAIALMLPCPITVYTQAGKTRITTMLPSVIGEFFPGKGIETVAAQVEKAVVEIVDASAR
ncbi:MAG TPA: DUF302 domain-containing protein [Candidatus Saccharimonadales bacterium]|nr:DUF302 domain-containing protein [Candidatus Saccharimonadales bacterium]